MPEKKEEERKLGSNYLPPDDPNLPDPEEENKKGQAKALEQQQQRGNGPETKGIGAPEKEENLDDHTIEELRAIADREGADLSGYTVKADIIKAIKKHRREENK
jgi:hypothetical protein